MVVQFLHSADLQIGKPFESFDTRSAELLRDYRLESIERLAEVAGDREVDFVVLAGDVFDSNTLPDERLGPAMPKFGAFDVPVYLLPGNHDFAGTPRSIYRRELFRAEKPDHLHVLSAREPMVVADGEAVLLPAPLYQNRHPGDPTEHLEAEFGAEAGADPVRIGVAHGGIGDKGEFVGANRIPEDRATLAELDYLALGDFHGTERIDARTWYAGAPERSNFSNNRQGLALVVDVDGPGAEPAVEEVDTGRATWIERSVTIAESGDVDELERWFDDLDEIGTTIIRLELQGTASLAVDEQLEDLLDRKSNLALSLEVTGEVLERPEGDELQRLRDRGGLVPQVVEALEARDEEAAGDTASRALSLLYRLSEEQS